MAAVLETTEVETVTMIDCPSCKGRGEVKDPWPLRPNRYLEIQFVTCTECNGLCEVEVEE